ncbi:MAG: DUF554 domain-containing protein [bacterium]|nr:DUF554 domain-containing protein [bacterium]
MIGTIANTAAVIAGSLLGLLLHKRMPEKYSVIVMQAIGLFTLIVGLDLSFKSSHLFIVLIALVLGGLLGQWWDIEQRLEDLGKALEARFSKGKSDKFVTGFVTASLLFCIGPMTIVGCLQDGLKNDHTLLFTKSLMDGISSIALAASLGLGVLFSALTVLLYQCLLTLLAYLFQGVLPAPYIDVMSAAGGLLVLGIGLNILGNLKLKIANLLPAVFLSPLLLGLSFWMGWIK